MKNYRDFDISKDLLEKTRSLPVRPEDVTHLVVHKRCKDGFGSYVAARYGREYCIPGDSTMEVINASHGDPVPPFPPDAVVAIVDFSWSRAELVELQSKVRGLVVLDHHEKARINLEGLPFALFDMNRSGCAMAWAYFCGGIAEYPWLLRYVEDRDLWTWVLLHSKEISARISELPETFDDWLKAFSISPGQFASEGSILMSSRARQVKEACENSWTGYVDGHRVPMTITAHHTSEIGEELCLRNPDSAFAAVGYYKNGKLFWSLRSRYGYDVNNVAMSFGGGGHKAAAGFEDPYMKNWEVHSSREFPQMEAK